MSGACFTIASTSSTRQLNTPLQKKKKKKVAGIGSAEQVEGLICIASPPERFSITCMHYSYTQVNTQHEFDEGRVSERLFGADV